MDEGLRETDPSSEELPAVLIEALRADAQARILVPDACDDAVLARARQHLAPLGRRRIAFRTLRAAAAIALAAGIVLLFLASPRQAVHRHDVNGDGALDILDAFTVARGVTRGATEDGWDVTGDGRVDQRDVDALAALAVALPEEAG